MHTISWIIRAAQKPQSGSVVRFFQKLQALGCNLHWVPTSKDMPLDAQWLSGQLNAETKFVFLSSFSATEMKEIVEIFKATIVPDRPALTLAAVNEKISPELLTQFVSANVDEFICLDEDPQLVLQRLQMRSAHVETKRKLEHSMREEANKNAKSETILGQREEFLSVCAHDLRSPLGLIQSSLSMVLSSSSESLNELQKELITRARRQAGEAISLVNDLLDVMSFEQGLKPQYQLFQLEALLKPFYKDYQFQANQKGVQFHYENPVSDWRVLADSDRIRQLMQNLVVNALKFTEKGKNIFLNVMPFQGRRKNDPIYPMIVVSIKDEGRGIPQKELQKIFDRFTQVKDQARSDGRGLGLTVAKQISTLHDGNIWVQSVEGEGSTFFVLFPHVISRIANAIEPNPKKPKKILIVDPAAKNRDRYYEILKRWGYELFFANDGVDAITLCFYHLPDVVIFSENLAKMEEGRVADTLRADPLTNKIALILAAESIEKHMKSKEDFAFDGLLKLPFSRESFQIELDYSTKKKAAPKKKAA